MCPRKDSNLRPLVPETNALSPELRGQVYDLQFHSIWCVSQENPKFQPLIESIV